MVRVRGWEGGKCGCETRGRANGVEVNPRGQGPRGYGSAARGQGPRGYGSAAHGLPAC